MDDLFSNVSYDLVNSPKGTVSLEIDLEKSRPGLVPKKVVIHQENGKTHMGIRWVKPGEEGSTSEPKPAPQESSPVKGNALYPDSDLNKQSEQSDHDEDRVDMSETTPQELEQEPEKDNSYLSQYLFDDDEYEDPWADFSLDDLPGREVDMVFNPDASIGLFRGAMLERRNEALELSGVHSLENFGGYLNDLHDSLAGAIEFEHKGCTMMSCLKLFEPVVDRHCKVFKEDTLSYIDSVGTDRFVTAVQKGIVNDRVFNSSDPFGKMCMVPMVLKHALLYTMGEELYTEARNQLYNANITINTTSSHLEDIMEKGYKGMDVTDYIKSKTSSPSALEFWDEMCEYSEDEDTWDKIRQLKNEGGFWYDVAERAEAEHRSMGLELEDRKPCYIAYNPDGDNSTGGAPEYGDGSVIAISDEILSQCTIVPSDSFLRTGCCPTIQSDDHLKDMFIFRALQYSDNRYSGMDFNDVKDDDREFIKSGAWLTELKHGGEIPLEIQYHHPVISPEHITIVNNSEEE